MNNPHWRRFVPAALLVVAMRLRFIWTPITSDEGGFLAIARAWHRGATLYDEVWVDRPQGLILLFRALHAIGLGTPEGVRLLAIVACIAAAIGCGLVADELFGRRSGAITAVGVAALASVPQYEGFLANGELLSGSIGAVGLALVLRACWNVTTPSMRRLAAAGAVAGCAFVVKQSGFDAFAAASVAVAWRSLGRTWPRRARLLALPAVLGGFLVPLALSMLHGALTGWDRYWYAVYGYRSSQRSALRDANFDRFRDTWEITRPAFLPALILALVGLVLAATRRRGGATVVALSWVVVALGAFALGGQFHRHYWVILTFPAATVAAGSMSLLRRRPRRLVATGAVAVAPLVLTAQALTIPLADVGPRLHNDRRLIRDERIAAWFRANRAPGETIYAFCASAGLYGNVGTDPPFRYLWADPIENVPGAPDELVAMLESEQRPTYLARYQRPSFCGAPAEVGDVIDRHYERVATIDGVPVLRRQDRDDTSGRTTPSREARPPGG